MQSIPKKIEKLLEIRDRLTISEITEGLNEQNRERLVRTSIYRLINRGTIVKNGKRGNAYQYSLKRNAKDDNDDSKNELLKFMYETMNDRMVWKNGAIESFTDEEKSKIKKVREILQIHV